MNARAQPLALEPPTVWSLLAKQWRVIDAPLRPSAEDIRVYEDTVDRWQQAHPGRAVRGLLLGVTAEIATMQWPQHASLVAVDHSFPMVAHVWPKPAHGSAVCADWRSMPLAPHSRDVAFGDGCLTLLSVPQGREVFAKSVRSVLTEDGTLALRCFCRPGQAEAPQQVFADLAAGRIRGFHAFKWRLAMALHGAAEQGVRLADVWDCWSAEVADPDAVAARCGWPPEAVHSLQVYRGSETRYMFATEEEVREALAPWLAFESRHVGSYELAERCPILVFRPA
jgi:hypothetical protein